MNKKSARRGNNKKKPREKRNNKLHCDFSRRGSMCVELVDSMWLWMMIQGRREENDKELN
jgi:hypothetical protein